MENIAITGYTIKQVQEFLLVNGFNKTRNQIWDFFKTKSNKGEHYSQEVEGGNLEIKEDGVYFYLGFLENQEKFKNKTED